MVAPLGYQTIVRFDQIGIGEEFASTRTGRHYAKIGPASWERRSDSRHVNAAEDLFEPATLVYRYPYAENTI